MDPIEEFWATFGDAVDTSYYYDHEGQLSKVNASVNNLLCDAGYRAKMFIKITANVNTDSSDSDLVKTLVKHIHWLRGVNSNIETLTNWLSGLREMEECIDASLDELVIRRRRIMTTLATYITEIESRQDYIQRVVSGKKIVRH